MHSKACATAPYAARSSRNHCVGAGGDGSTSRRRLARTVPYWGRGGLRRPCVGQFYAGGKISACCLVLSSSFFPRLFSAVADWMSILHRPTCEFRMNACLKCAARSSLKIQDATIRHLHTIAQLCRAISSQLRHVSTIGKKTC